MAKLIIQGGTSLEGDIRIAGAKNAALKMMAASILTDEEVILHNVPDIQDIRTTIQILEGIGAKISFSNNSLSIDPSGITSFQPDYQLVKHLRGSVVVIGPLLAKFKSAKIPQPGGCLIGARPIETHSNALQQLNVTVNEDKDYYLFETKKLIGAKITLDEMSVTATENVMMAATLAEGVTEIRLAAAEPEISDLASMLNKMGAKISGAGTNIIFIEGVKKLTGVEHTVIPDRIEAGTFAIAAAVSRGDVRIQNIIPEHMSSILMKFKHANVSFGIENNNILHIKPTTSFEPITIDTRPYPGFPTDLQAPLAVLLTQANGTSKIFETMYDGRLEYSKELKKMGADLTIHDAHTLMINGPTPLYGKKITSLDIRAGATLLIAALIAQGQSTIERSELIDRGYEHIDKRLNSLGANIKRDE